MSSTLRDDVDEWVRATASGTVTAIKPIAGGGQRITYFVEVDAAPELVLQVNSGTGPFDGKNIVSLGRESRLLNALSGSQAAPVVPETLGANAQGDAMLTVRAPGESDFERLTDDAVRLKLTNDFIDALALLHSVDSSVADSVGFDPVGDGTDAALRWVAPWKRLFEDVTRPAPLVRFALQWIEANAPTRIGPVVICHGDTGPGNFLFVGDQLIKLIDWELSHLGEYHCDLGMVALRGFQLRSMGDLDAAFQRYATVSGRRIDGWMVRYYRAVALILGLVTTLTHLDRATATEKPLLAMPHYLHLLPMFQLWLAEALLDLAGLVPEEPDLPEEDTDLDALDAALAYAGLEHVLSDRALAGGTTSFADLSQHLVARARFGRSVERAELDDLERLLGSRPANITAGKAMLDRELSSSRLDETALLQWAYRSSKRQSRLWPAWGGLYERPLKVIADEYLPDDTINH